MDKVGIKAMKCPRRCLHIIFSLGLVAIFSITFAIASAGHLDKEKNRVSNPKHGFIDKTGELVFAVDSKANVESFSDGYACKRNEDYSFIDKLGHASIPGPFKLAEPFSEGLVAVGYFGKFGYIDTAGKLAIKPIYEIAKPFHEGLAAVKLNDKFGFIDKKGKLVIDALYDGAGAFSNGLAAVEVEKKIGFIDHSGRWRIEPRFSFAEGFTEEVSLVRSQNSTNKPNGYVDVSGKIRFYANYANNQNPTNNLSGSDTALSLNNGFGSGWSKVVSSPAIFSDGLVAIPKDPKGKVGYADKDGEFKIEPQFDQAYPFAEGLALVVLDNKFGFVNKQGSIVIKPMYLNANNFCGGLAAVEVEKSKWGFIDPTGKMVIKPQFAYAWSFSEGLAHVRFSETE